MNSFRRFFWEDMAIRRVVYLFGIVIGVAYATVRSVVFHVPEHHVELEMSVLLILWILASVAILAWRHRGAGERPPLRSTRGIPLWLGYGGVGAIAVLIAALKISVPSVQAAIVTSRLHNAASRIEPKRAVHLSNDEIEADSKK